jgi:Formate--tetrahydrofolate ligase
MKSSLEIAQDAQLEPIASLAHRIGLEPDEYEPYGRHKAKVALSSRLPEFCRSSAASSRDDRRDRKPGNGREYRACQRHDCMTSGGQPSPRCPLLKTGCCERRR